MLNKQQFSDIPFETQFLDQSDFKLFEYKYKNIFLSKNEIKEKVLKMIGSVINEKDLSRIRPEYLRGL